MSLADLHRTIEMLRRSELPEETKALLIEETERRIATHGRIQHNWGAPIEHSQPRERDDGDGVQGGL